MYAFSVMQRLVTAAILYVALTLAHAGPQANDPLNEPAKNSALATRSAFTTITRSGARLFAGGERGLILYSDDQGKTWGQASVPVRVTLTSIRFADASHGWAVGNGGAILRTEDGGAHWSKQLDGNAIARMLEQGAHGLTEERRKRLIGEGADKPFLDIYIKDADNAMAVGAYGLIFATSDAGKNWRPVFGRVGAAEERHFYALRKVGSSLYLAGEQGLLYRSTDEGMSFVPVATPGKATIFSVVGSQHEVILFGLRGAAYQSRDGGASWKRIELQTRNSLTDARQSSDGSAYLVVDDGGSVWRLAGDGSAVGRVPTAAVFPFSGLEVLADGTAVVVGALGFSHTVNAN
jgi:photosystem II stability/assembly factor-like uncharacterized protein